MGLITVQPEVGPEVVGGGLKFPGAHAQQPARLQQLVALYENYAKEKGIVPVAENWSPWQGDLKQLPRPAVAPLPTPAELP